MMADTERPSVPSRPRPRSRAQLVALGVLVAVVGLAVVEAVAAVVAPFRVPRRADWEQAAQFVRTQKRPGDLVLFAPAWVDPLGRMYLGDVISFADAGRMDAARYGRLIEVAIRGAHAPETRAPGVKPVLARRFGRVGVTVYEKPKVEVVYDFLDHWREARVSRWRGGREEAACTLATSGERFQCPGIGTNEVALRMTEPDYTAKRCIYVPPVAGAEVRVAFRARLGTVIAGRTGLDYYYWRKVASGKVRLQVTIDGRERLALWHGPHDGWRPFTVDTAAERGGEHEVVFVISSPQPYGRRFCFAAEARD